MARSVGAFFVFFALGLAAEEEADFEDAFFAFLTLCLAAEEEADATEAASAACGAAGMAVDAETADAVGWTERPFNGKVNLTDVLRVSIFCWKGVRTRREGCSYWRICGIVGEDC